MVLSWSLLPGLAGGGGGGGGGGGARASSKAVYDFRLDEQDWDKVCWGRVDKAAARSLTHQLSRRAKWAAVLRAATAPQGGGWAPDFTADEMTPGRLQALARVIDAEFFQGSFHRTLARRSGRPLVYRSALLEPGSAPVGDAAMSAAVAGHTAEVAVAGHTAGVAVAPSRAVAGALAAAAAATAHPARCGCCNSCGNSSSSGSSSSSGNSSSSGSSSSRGLAVLHRAAAAVAAPGARVPVAPLALSPAALPSATPTPPSFLWQHSLHSHRRQHQQLFATAAGAAAAASAPPGFRGQTSTTSAAPAPAAAAAAVASAAAAAVAVADRGSHLLSFSLHSASSSPACSSSSSPSSSVAPPSAASPPLLVCSARARSRRLHCGLPPPLVLAPPPAWEGNRGGGGGRRWQLTDKGRIRVLSPEPSEPPGGPGQAQQLGAQEVCGAGMRGGRGGGGRGGWLRTAAAGTGAGAAAGGAEAAAARPVAAGGPSATYSHGQGSVTFWQQVWDSYSPSVGRPVRLDGVVCDTKLSWLAHTLGHEMLHALLFTMCADTAAQAPKNMSYQGHGHNFLVLNWALYGHRGHVYEPAAGWRPAPAPPLRL